MNRCITCGNRDTSGFCLSDKIRETDEFSDKQKVDMLVYSYNEGGGFYVGEKFGCVHHTANDIQIFKKE